MSTETMKAKLAQSGIPATEIKVLGSHVIVRAASLKTAERWVSLLSRVGYRNVRSVESRRDNAVNEGSMLNPSSHVEWLIGGAL